MSASVPPLGSLAVKDTILYRALRLAQITGGPGRSASPDQLNDALLALNGLIESLDIQPDAIYSVNANRYTLSPAKQVYTIGKDPTGAVIADFDAPRPIRIHQAKIVLTTSPSAVYVDLPLVTAEEWAEITTRAVTSSIPQVLYCDYDYPLAGLHFWPASNGSNDVELWTWQPVAQIETVADQVLMPPGYADMFVYQLAVRLAEQFGTVISPNVFSTANKLLGRIKAFNHPSTPIGSVDAGTSGSTGGYFNYISGTRA